MFSPSFSAIPQLPMPTHGIEFNPANVATVTLASSSPAVASGSRPHLALLMDAPQTLERDALLQQYVDVCERIDAYLSEVRASRIAELEMKRAEAWQRCRAIEDRQKDLAREIGVAQGQLRAFNEPSVRLQELSHAADRARPQTQFPTQAELALWNDARGVFEREVSLRKSKKGELEAQLSALEQRKYFLSIEKRDAVEELRMVDTELNGIRKQ